MEQEHPELVEVFKEKMELFVKGPFHPFLRTHSLSGVLQELWSLRINYECRLIFKFAEKRKRVLLIDIGTHNEVY
ncbi:MAG: hypothetical protein HY769_10280 [Candidatus Stahlbacteria bacterium]|nr:hypothetical protein [Candidatus Stahlbacteria bacterium]